MIYPGYMVKKRMRVQGICGRVNLPYGTILPAENGFILYNGKHLCAVQSQNAKDYFWGYAEEKPEEEVRRQQLAAELLKLAPQEDTQALFETNSPWRKYGRLEQIPTGFEWVWNLELVEDLPRAELERLLSKIGVGGHVTIESGMKKQRRDEYGQQ